MQPYLSSSDGTPKWAKIEMWPMMVRMFLAVALATPVVL